MTSLGDKVAVLCGAGGSLGRALIEAFDREGVHALGLGDLSSSAIGIDDLNLRSEYVTRDIDVRDQNSVSALVNAAFERWGRVDVVVNNAGVLSPNGRLHNLGDADWQRAFEVNVMGAVHGIRAAVDVMRTTGGGAIINTASVAGLTAWAYAGPYAVTKAAVIQLTKVAALEYARDGIRVNCVSPGVFPSAMHAEYDETVMRALADKHPLGLGNPESMVAAYVYLASDGASWTTGSNVVVDGGYSVP